MNARFFAIAVLAASLAGCAAAPGSKAPGPAYETEMKDGRPGLLGDLTWNIDIGEKRQTAPAPAASSAPAVAPAAAVAAPMTAAEQEEFKKWQESAGRTERQEFEEWRAWQEWKRKNPK
jgi:hypothetical protein